MSARDDPAPIRRYHFHMPGVMYVLVTLFIAVGAINGQNNLLFAGLGLAIGGLLSSGVISGAALMGVRLRRVPGGPATAGRAYRLRYEIANANRVMPVFGLHVEEAVERRAKAASRAFAGARAFAAYVGPRRTQVIAAPLRPMERGVARLPAVRVWSTFPFGLARKSLTFEAPRSIEVRPADLPLRGGLVERLAARASAGVDAERAAGSGEEFFGLREYVVGDSPRQIAWRASARTGTLVVRQHAMPSPIRLWVVLRFGDAGSADRRLSERAIALAASLLRAADEQGVAVGLAVPAGPVVLPPRVDRRQLDRALSALAGLNVPNGSGAAEGFPEAAARASHGAVCVVVHAGGVDRSFAPPHAWHLSAADPASWLEDSADARHILAELDAAVAERAA